MESYTYDVHDMNIGRRGGMARVYTLLCMCLSRMCAFILLD